nr:unnamed protein product [Haemonchus contortus]
MWSVLKLALNLMKNEVKLKASGQSAQDTRNKRLCPCMQLIHYLKVAVQTARQQAVTYPFHGRSDRGSRIGHVVHYGTACHRSSGPSCWCPSKPHRLANIMETIKGTVSPNTSCDTSVFKMAVL